MKSFLGCRETAALLAGTIALSMFCVGCNENSNEAVAKESQVDIETTSSSEEIVFDIVADETSKVSDSQPGESEFECKEITVDYYKIPEIYSGFVTDEELKFYNDFVTAWLNYEPVVEFDNIDVLQVVWGMVQECFFLAYGDLDMENGYDVDDHHVYLHYLSDSKEEHDEVIRQFEERVQFFFNDIAENAEGIDLARQLYTNFCQTIRYSYEVVDSDNFTYENSSGYAALMRGEGVCMSFSKAYVYMLRQAGFEAFYVSGFEHAWGAVRYDGKYYFVDPTWDYVYDPEDYYYFLFGLDRREEVGYMEEDMYLCCNDKFKMSDYVKIERGNYQGS